jgi:hypothetical protein
MISSPPIAVAPLFLGDNKSRVAGVGPQIGYIIPMGDLQGYVNLKGYRDFDASRGANGWNMRLAFSISAAAPSPSTNRRQ